MRANGTSDAKARIVEIGVCYDAPIQSVSHDCKVKIGDVKRVDARILVRQAKRKND